AAALVTVLLALTYARDARELWQASHGRMTEIPHAALLALGLPPLESGARPPRVRCPTHDLRPPGMDRGMGHPRASGDGLPRAVAHRLAGASAGRRDRRRDRRNPARHAAGNRASRRAACRPPDTSGGARAVGALTAPDRPATPRPG